MNDLLEIKGLLIGIETNVWELGIKTIQKVQDVTINDETKMEILKQSLEAAETMKKKLELGIASEKIKELAEYKNTTKALQEVSISFIENLNLLKEIQALEALKEIIKAN